MSDVTDRFARATGHFGDLVHQIKDDQWGNPTASMLANIEDPP